MRTVEELLRHFVEDEPFGRHSTSCCCEGCGEAMTLETVDDEDGNAYMHAADCPWVEARRLLGLELPSHHRARPTT